MILNLLNIIYLFISNNYAKDYVLIYQVNLLKLRNQTSQSFEERNDLKSSLVVDGDVYTCAMIRLDPQKNTEAWWRIELDRSYDITHIKLLKYRDSIDTFLVSSIQIIVSKGTDNRLCTWLRNKYLRYKNGVKDLYCVNAVNGNVVTIKKFEWHLFLCEVQVFADLKSVNLAYKRPLAQKGILLSDTSYLSVDGDPKTCAVVIYPEYELAWLLVVLDDIYYVTDVTYSFKKPKTGEWYLKEVMMINLSDNAKNYDERLCSEVAENYYTKTNVSLSIKCDKPIPARFVTIRKFTGTITNVLVICDVEVYSRGFPHEMSNITSPDCYPYEYKCLEGGCIHKDWLCDGTNDCPLADDEAPSCKRDENQFKCKRINETIDAVHRCDGVYNCPDYSDEEYCFEIYNEHMTAIFKGEKNLYICSDNWNVKYSEDICRQYDRHYIGTYYVSHIIDSNFIRINFNRTLSDDTSFMALFEKYRIIFQCTSKKIVNVECAYKPVWSYSCGKRYLPDAVYESYIINGRVSRAGAWPWHVQIFVKDFVYSVHFCGGSLIDRYWVLTAAHCVIEFTNIKDISMKIGSVTSDDYLTETHYPSHVIIHPLYTNNYTHSHYDVALIRLETMAKLSRLVRPICLPDRVLDEQTLMSFRHCYVVGFGENKNGYKSHLLQQARMNFVTNEECQQYLRNATDSKYTYFKLKDTYCAGQIPLADGSNICKGDSGCPHMCKGQNGIWTQVGIAHMFYRIHGEKCKNSIFVDVSSHLDFIRSEIKRIYKSKFSRISMKHFEVVQYIILEVIIRYL